MSETQPWLLKILSGPHLGAEVPLTGDGYRIGSDSECDIVLADASIRPCHATLKRTETGWRLTAVDGPVLVGEESLTPGQVVVLTEGQVFALGTTHIGCGPAAMDWSGRVLPAAVLLPAVMETSSAQVEDVPGPYPRLTRRRWFLGLVSLGGLVLLLALGWLILLEPGSAAPPVPLEQDMIARLVAKFPLRGVQIHHTPSGWTVTGWCDRESDRHKLREALVGLSFPAVSRVRSVEGMVAAAKAVVQGMDSTGGLQITATGDGRLEVRGRLPDDTRRRELLHLLREDVPGVVALSDRIETTQAGDEQPVVKLAEPPLEEKESGHRLRGIVRWNQGGYVVFDDWVPLPVGAMVDGKWRIRRIGERRVWLSDGKQIIIRYLGESL